MHRLLLALPVNIGIILTEEFGFIGVYAFTVGLVLTIFVNQREYIGVVSQSAGVRLLVHRIDHHPFLEDDGRDVSPGTLASIKVNLVS